MRLWPVVGRGYGKAIGLGFAKAVRRLYWPVARWTTFKLMLQRLGPSGGEAFPRRLILENGRDKQDGQHRDGQFGRMIYWQQRWDCPAWVPCWIPNERIWENVINLNLKGVYFTSQAVAKIMKKQGGGKYHIVSFDGFQARTWSKRLQYFQSWGPDDTSAFALELAAFIYKWYDCSRADQHEVSIHHWFNLPPEKG